MEGNRVEKKIINVEVNGIQNKILKKKQTKTITGGMVKENCYILDDYYIYIQFYCIFWNLSLMCTHGCAQILINFFCQKYIRY